MAARSCFCVLFDEAVFVRTARLIVLGSEQLVASLVCDPAR